MSEHNHSTDTCPTCAGGNGNSNAPRMNGQTMMAADAPRAVASRPYTERADIEILRQRDVDLFAPTPSAFTPSLPPMPPPLTEPPSTAERSFPIPDPIIVRTREVDFFESPPPPLEFLPTPTLDYVRISYTTRIREFDLVGPGILFQQQPPVRGFPVGPDGRVKIESPSDVGRGAEYWDTATDRQKAEFVRKTIELINKLQDEIKAIESQREKNLLSWEIYRIKSYFWEIFIPAARELPEFQLPDNLRPGESFEKIKEIEKSIEPKFVIPLTDWALENPPHVGENFRDWLNRFLKYREEYLERLQKYLERTLPEEVEQLRGSVWEPGEPHEPESGQRGIWYGNIIIAPPVYIQNVDRLVGIAVAQNLQRRTQCGPPSLIEYDITLRANKKHYNYQKILDEVLQKLWDCARRKFDLEKKIAESARPARRVRPPEVFLALDSYLKNRGRVLYDPAYTQAYARLQRQGGPLLQNLGAILRPSGYTGVPNFYLPGCRPNGDWRLDTWLVGRQPRDRGEGVIMIGSSSFEFGSIT